MRRRAIDYDRDLDFECFGLRTVNDRYLLRHRQTRAAVESPQYWLMRVACGLARSASMTSGAHQPVRVSTGRPR